MINYFLNGTKMTFSGNPEISLLNHLRLDLKITSVKDGCSGQGTCGACTVEINGKARLACTTKMKSLDNAHINTTEGLPEEFKNIIGEAFVEKGAVQCGFCSPGILMRTKGLYNANPSPSRHEITKAISPNLCRCTGYVKIIDAIEAALKKLNGEVTELPV
ncbi:MAG: 2Fe-2S iron-sulfur cluster binding domain-containing protein, partial [Bacteroidales bacterium]|nr:2Fe-2S iron-sulfur cluster binding domain-containing protein [Bacteroidales bacterium]